ncbi:MAG: FG-GAP repeat domain-containing protein [Gammaproteobacteria bacterium]
MSLGDGAGGFVAGREQDLYGEDVKAGAAGDFNGDGFTDLVVTSNDTGNGGIFLYSGDETGEFARPVTVASLPSTSVAAGDFNRDGSLDLASQHYSASDKSTAEVSIFLGYGNGVFSSTVSVLGASDFDRFGSVITGDFNADGLLDIASQTEVEAGIKLSVATGDGFGNFTAEPDVMLDGLTGASIESAAGGDFNGDGIGDLALRSTRISSEVQWDVDDWSFGFDFPEDDSLGDWSDLFSDAISVYIGDGAGGFTPYASIDGDTGSSIGASDFNLDGVLDLISVDAFGRTIYLGDGIGGFEPQPSEFDGGGEHLDFYAQTTP